MDKTALQQSLSRLEPVATPDTSLEQYQTPGDIAADVLHRMRLNDELDGSIVDMGCGNGVFTIGAALLGATATGIDVDEEAVETARNNLATVREETEQELAARFVVADVRDMDTDAATVVTNPPFGIQRADMNRVFLRAAFETAGVVYALLHRSERKTEQTRSFIEQVAENHGFDTDGLATYDFPLPRTQDYHETEKKYIKVDLYRFQQV